MTTAHPQKTQFTVTQIAAAIELFAPRWQLCPLRMTAPETSRYPEELTHEEFYHGSCSYFSTALAAALGRDDCQVFNLYGRRDDGSEEMIHSVVEYMPLRLAAKDFDRTQAGEAANFDAGPVFDASSARGCAWDQAEHAFIEDPYEPTNPFHMGPEKWPRDKTAWKATPPEHIAKMVADYEAGTAPKQEVEYWSAIRDCLSQALAEAREQGLSPVKGQNVPQYVYAKPKQELTSPSP